MMLIVALGAIRAILSTSPGLSSRFSTLTISFLLSDFDDTFIATLTMCPSPPPIPRIFRTSRAWPAEIWSMTEPLRIFLTKCFLAPLPLDILVFLAGLSLLILCFIKWIKHDGRIPDYQTWHSHGRSYTCNNR